MNVKHVIWASIMSTTISCQSVKKEYTSFEEYPIPKKVSGNGVLAN